MNILYIPHKGKNRNDEGERWEKGIKWGSDFMLDNVLKLHTKDFEISANYNFGAWKNGKYDLVHLHNIATTALHRTILLQRNSRIKKYVKIKERPKFIGGVRGFVGYERSNKFLKYFDAVHVSNKDLYNFVSMKNPNVFLLYPGVDIDMFNYIDEPDDFYIGWAGDKNKSMKNFHILDRLDYPKILATKENFIPHNKMPHFYNNCSVYTYFSSHEGCNRTIVEAAACERPIVTSNAGAVGDFIDDDFIVKCDPEKEEKFIEEVTKKIEYFREDENIRREVGKRNRKSVLKLDWKHVVNRIEEMWRKVIN